MTTATIKQEDPRATYLRRSGDRKDFDDIMWVCNEEKSGHMERSVDAARYRYAVCNATVTNLTSTWLSSGDRDSRCETRYKVQIRDAGHSEASGS